MKYILLLACLLSGRVMAQTKDSILTKGKAVSTKDKSMKFYGGIPPKSGTINRMAYKFTNDGGKHYIGYNEHVMPSYGMKVINDYLFQIGTITNLSITDIDDKGLITIYFRKNQVVSRTDSSITIQSK